VALRGLSRCQLRQQNGEAFRAQLGILQEKEASFSFQSCRNCKKPAFSEAVDSRRASGCGFGRGQQSSGRPIANADRLTSRPHSYGAKKVPDVNATPQDLGGDASCPTSAAAAARLNKIEAFDKKLRQWIQQNYNNDEFFPELYKKLQQRRTKTY
jgi:hypothetical protein